MRRPLSVLAAVALILAGLTATASAATGYLPKVRSLSMKSGSPYGGTFLTLHGINFRRGMTVLFGRRPVRITRYVSTSEATVYSVAHAPGTVDVQVQTSNGTSPRHWADRFTYLPYPRLTSAAPTGGPASGGTRVTLHGTALSPVQRVLFGPDAAGTALTHVDAGTLTVTAPAHGTGHVDVSLVAWSRTLGTAVGYTYATARPQPVTGLAVTDSTARSATLAWTPSATAGADRAEVVRRTGTVAPAAVSDGTVVATTASGVTTLTDRDLALGTTYSYGVFALGQDGVPSAPAGVTVTTPTTSHPNAPTALAVVPTPVGHPSDGSGWVGSTAGGPLTAAAMLSDDDPGDTLTGHFRLLDVTGSGAPVVLASANSALVTNGSTAIAPLPVTAMTEGHTFAVDATADDGTRTGPPSAQCRFRYDSVAPSTTSVTSNGDTSGGPTPTVHLGQPITFVVSGKDEQPATGTQSGPSYFAYSLTSPSAMQHYYGFYTFSSTLMTTSIIVTPNQWGTNHLYVQTVDNAGNPSPVYTYEYYVIS